MGRAVRWGCGCRSYRWATYCATIKNKKPVAISKQRVFIIYGHAPLYYYAVFLLHIRAFVLRTGRTRGTIATRSSVASRRGASSNSGAVCTKQNICSILGGSGRYFSYCAPANEQKEASKNNAIAKIFFMW